MWNILLFVLPMELRQVLALKPFYKVFESFVLGGKFCTYFSQSHVESIVSMIGFAFYN